MTNLSYRKMDSTSVSVAIMAASFGMATFFSAGQPSNEILVNHVSSENKLYSDYQNSGLAMHYQNKLLFECDKNFEQAISNFYAKLLAAQEPLGEEFEKILYENLWDLYEN